MRTEFELPDVGEGVAEGELVAWHVDVGETVEEDQVLAEVETDKALVEIPSPHDGEIAELRAEEGELVPVGDVLVVFEVDDDSGAEPAESTAPDDAGTEADDEPETAPTPDDAIGSETGPDTAGDGASVPSGRVFAPPSVRRLARELEVDVAALQANGSGGRLTERDVRAAANGASAGAGTTDSTSDAPTRASASAAGAESTGGGELEAAAAGGESATATAGGAHSAATDRDDGAVRVDHRGSADRDRTLAMPATRRLARERGVSLDAVPASEERDGEAFVTPEDVRSYAAGGPATAESAELPTPDDAAGVGDSSTSSVSGGDAGAGASASATDGPVPGDRVPYTGVRRTIGEQMAASKYTAPHVSHHDEVEVSDLVDARSRLKERAAERGVKLTYMPFAVKAVVAALKEVPQINAELDEENEEILLKDEYNVGIAVASDAGLMVPVIDNADRKGLLELAREINDKAERARNRTIGLEEMQGGTFTITNVGAIGGEYASPIINHPEAGILALGSMKERPWVDDGEVVARPTMPISMSVDHRIVDGAEAAQFTNEVKRYLNNPELLLLE
ncbi:2-oxo acid dehydrogenase subunit E2 [Natronolimnohabitans innermongolicus]|uniref:Branched-chain alpha-keto acid dehydrogenase subunit E2 n=1 Tax=Natronolimnohabitans innermongolicus JCM 12255 TaxID=1227499 RepID=L9WNA7_9EURY|nr:2-oxo acid dehydrogenase subunit E2 [Natronolimnohabitans innermongolicus]ELY50955.1 branched-chain alpha-keto acid dehydrogenase subunit E2 [Natronolimnohabitans innermongolicus JCM 12255]